MPEFLLGDDHTYQDLNPVVAGCEQCLRTQVYGPAVRSYYLIHYVFSGSGYFQTEQTTYRVSPGYAFLIKPGQITRYFADSDDPWMYAWVGFTGKLADRFADLHPVFPTEVDIFQDICDMADLEGARKPYLISKLFCLYARLFQDVSVREDRYQKIQEYIHLNYMRDLSVDGLADLAGLNRRYFSRCFKQQLGLSPKQYLTRVRVQQAAHFLSKGCSVGQVAKMVGYYDTLTFSKMFKAITGKSPAQWKKERPLDSRQAVLLTNMPK